MYNQDLKERYIEYKNSITISSPGSLKRLFIRTYPYEEKANKDICCFVESEIISVYKMLGTRSLGTIQNMNSQLSQYTDWCLAQGLVYDGQNHFRVLKKDAFETCINKAAIKHLSITREELLSSIKVLPNDRDKFLMLYLFEVGNKQYFKELSELTVNSFEGNILHLRKRDVKVSDELIAYAIKAAEATEMYPYRTGHLTHYKTEPDGHIIQIRSSVSNDTSKSANKYYTIFVNAISYMGFGAYKPKEIEYMGRIHLIRKMAKEQNLSLYDTVKDEDNYKVLQNQYGFKEPRQTFWENIERYL